jgi:hypothetical protein
MKLILMLSATALVIAAVLSFTILKGEDGKPLLSFSDFKVLEIDLTDYFLVNLPESWWSSSSDSPRAESTIYQWTDSEGNLQFSNSPPPEGIEYTAKKYDPNENVIPAVSTDSSDAGQLLNKSSQNGDFGGIFSAGVIEKLFKDANNVDQSQTDRKNNLDAVHGQ